MSVSRRCGGCDRTKPLNEKYWIPFKKGPDGFRGRCRSCIRRQQRMLKARKRQAKERVCSQCGESQPLIDACWVRRPNGTFGSPCRQCRKNRSRVKARQAKATEDPSEWAAKRRNYAFRKKYGITLQDYDQMVKDQGGCCANPACLFIHNENGGRLDRLYVDHDNLTGEVRGLLCHACNTGLGHFYHSPKLLLGGIRYLQVNNPPKESP